MKKLFFISLFFLIIPSYSQAAIVINEIAWMGNSVSANDEWIELYNSGSTAVDVAGWVLSDGMNLSVPLAGSIASGQYAVLERTDDASAPGSAFLVYVGSLVNTGATLSLYRTDNTLEDRVSGGEDWGSVGGDNVTKETAQYTTGGWITAQATPGASNAYEDNPTEADALEDSHYHDEENNNDSNQSTKSSSKKKSSASTPLGTQPRALSVSMNTPNRVYVNQEVSMQASAGGLSKTIINSLRYDWNFGDFNTSKAKEATHRFNYPGEYVVTLRAYFKEYEAFTRATVVVLPVNFSITTNTNGDVQVHNDAPYEVDMSGYSITSGNTLKFPKGTILLPNATITIPKKKIKYSKNASLFDDTATLLTSLYSIEATLAYSAPQEKKTAPVAQRTLSTVASEPTAIGTQSTEFTFVSAPQNTQASVPTPSTQSPASIENTNTQLASLTGTQPEPKKQIPQEKLAYLALLAVIAIGILAVFLGRKRNPINQDDNLQ